MRRLALFLHLWLAFACAQLLVGAARADEVEVREAELRATEDGLVLNAEFAFELNPRLAEAVANGIPLYFVVEFELTRPRWYWFDEKTAGRRMQTRLSYHPLSRQYRLSSGGLLQQSFPTLEQALGVLRRVRNWLVADRTVVQGDVGYEAAVRMRLDRAMLPKPFQLSAITSSEWQLESPWKRFPFRTGQQPPAPVESREPKRAPETKSAP